MKRILVLYYSRSGNTEKMAKAVAEGARESGDVSVELNFHVEPQELSGYDAIIFGAPTYHHAMPLDFLNLLKEAEAQGINLKGKIAGAFGSYGWSGEATKNLLETVKNRFEMDVVEPPLTVKYAPDQKTLDACKELGRNVSEKLKNKA